MSWLFLFITSPDLDEGAPARVYCVRSIMKDFREFVVAIYAASEPSVDFDKADLIKPWEHKLREDKYEELLTEFAGDDSNLRTDVCLWMLNQGPQLVRV